MNPELKTTLASAVQRVNFDRVERKIYGHDVADMPTLIKPLLGDTIPDGVVQPQNEQELVALVNWARQNKVPLTPRGKATSGYGGVLPVKQGIVVDFYQMRAVQAIDAEAQTVTTQPGISWELLDERLAEQGLTLRLYPSSYPSSTVGGWLAQGGAGFGSYEFGYFRDNVLSARVVQPDGQVKVFSGPELDVVSDAEGITGLISAVTLKVQPREALALMTAACVDAEDFQGLVEDIIQSDLPVWSFMFIDPNMADCKEKAPLRVHNGHPVGEHVQLPRAYILTVTYRQKNAAAIEAALPKLLAEHQATRLSEEIAQHEWGNRFNLMLVKRLGPSLVPAEVVVPVKNLAKALQELKAKVAQTLVKEGIILRHGRSGEPEAVILGFIPSDQRRLSYNLVFALSLSVMKIAEKYGGHAYSTGLYFSGKALSVLGKEQLERMRQFKARVDPQGIMNPGKVLGSGLIGTFMGLAQLGEPLERRMGNAMRNPMEEHLNHPVRDIPADIAWYAYACSQCGYCVDECDQFYGRGWESQSPRGKWFWLREHMQGREEWDQKMVDTFLVCTTCEFCDLRCCTHLPIQDSWMKMRGQLVHEEKKMTFPPFEMMAASTKSQGDIWAGYRKNRADWFPKDLVEKHGPQHPSKNVYFAGCTASYVENDIAIGTVRLLDAAGVDFTYLGDKESCCATPMLVAGKWDVFVETMKKNIQAVKDAGANTVICSCPACDMMWRHAYPEWTEKLGLDFGLRVRHYSEILSEQIRSGAFTFPANDLPQTTVTWHDSCHIGRVSGVYEPPRDLIKALPNVNLVEMRHNHAQALCCGSVLTLIREPEVAAEVGETRLNEAIEAGAEKVLALCPCCEFQLRVSADKKALPIEIVDLSAYAAKALGFELPDPRPEVKQQWAVFEAMIQLMTPQGFAALMETMWPELIDAMPYGMGPMMRAMGKIPGALNGMKPLFPVLFPRLLPMMMPKVMPTMLERIKAAVPMPDYMAEQMPQLLPEVMDNLMPHMIGDVVPLISQPMVNYLTGKNGKNG